MKILFYQHIFDKQLVAVSLKQKKMPLCSCGDVSRPLSMNVTRGKTNKSLRHVYSVNRVAAAYH